MLYTVSDLSNDVILYILEWYSFPLRQIWYQDGMTQKPIDYTATEWKNSEHNDVITRKALQHLYGYFLNDEHRTLHFLFRTISMRGYREFVDTVDLNEYPLAHFSIIPKLNSPLLHYVVSNAFHLSLRESEPFCSMNYFLSMFSNVSHNLRYLSLEFHPEITDEWLSKLLDQMRKNTSNVASRLEHLSLKLTSITPKCIIQCFDHKTVADHFPKLTVLKLYRDDTRVESDDQPDGSPSDHTIEQSVDVLKHFLIEMQRPWRRLYLRNMDITNLTRADWLEIDKLPNEHQLTQLGLEANMLSRETITQIPEGICWTRLQKFGLSNNKDFEIRYADIKKLTIHFPNLCELRLAESGDFSLDVLPLILNSLPSLRFLDLMGESIFSYPTDSQDEIEVIDQAIEQSISQHSHLAKLDFSMTEHLPCCIFRGIAHNKSIRNLYLWDIGDLQDTDLRILSHNDRITSLDISGNYFSDMEIPFLLTHDIQESALARSLKHLDISGSYTITESNLNIIYLNCKNLKDLTVGECIYSDDLAAKLVRMFAYKLDYLDLHTNWLTDNFIFDGLINELEHYIESLESCIDEEYASFCHPPFINELILEWNHVSDKGALALFECIKQVREIEKRYMNGGKCALRSLVLRRNEIHEAKFLQYHQYFDELDLGEQNRIIDITTEMTNSESDNNELQQQQVGNSTTIISNHNLTRLYFFLQHQYLFFAAFGILLSIAAWFGLE